MTTLNVERPADGWFRSVVARRLSAFLHSWVAYETPPDESPTEHLMSTLLERVIAGVTIQGILLLAVIGPLFAPRLMLQGAVFLLITSLARIVRRRFGARIAYFAAYLSSLIVLVPYTAVSGGVYSYAAGTILLLTIAASFAIEIRTTLMTLAAYTFFLGIMSFLQERGMWFQNWLSPSPGIMWLLRTQTTLNIMIPIVTTIQAYREALRQFERNVRDLRNAEETTRRLLESQSRFFWDISHELRSPLTRLTLSVGKVRRELGSRDEPAVERMENEVDRLNKLIHQLLLLAQLKHGVQFPMNQEFDLTAEVASVCQDAEFEAGVAGRDLSLETCSAFPARGCVELVRGAVENVIRNAIRFAPEGSEVEVRLSEPSRGLARIVVADRGPGVPESQIGMLFDPFFRVVTEASVPARRTGSGLGLAIAFEAVKKHGGRISAENRAGGGLIVTMEFPDRANGVATPERTAEIGSYASSE